MNGLHLSLRLSWLKSKLMKPHSILYPQHAKVLEMGCGLLRALSYYAECCVQLNKKKAVSVVVESIKHNPRKVDVMIEGR